MSGFGFLRYRLSSKTADSESTSVHSFAPSLPLQAGDIIGSCLEAPQRPGPALICPQGHTRMHTYKCTYPNKFLTHTTMCFSQYGHADSRTYAHAGEAKHRSASVYSNSHHPASNTTAHSHFLPNDLMQSIQSGPKLDV